MMYQNRQSYINNLNQFISTCKSTISDSLEVLEWTKESIFDACQKKRLSLNEDVKNAEAPKTGCLSNSSVQQNSDEPKGCVQESIATEQSYTELVESIVKQQNASKKENKDKKEILAEMLKLERDAKRRRMNYKNKVHTKHKSHIEIMREVLAEQMATLSESFSGEEANNSSKEESLKKDKCDLIEIQFPDGNPYLAWEKILKNDSHSEIKERINKNQDSVKDRNRSSYKPRNKSPISEEKTYDRPHRSKNEDRYYKPDSSSDRLQNRRHGHDVDNYYSRRDYKYSERDGYNESSKKSHRSHEYNDKKHKSKTHRDDERKSGYYKSDEGNSTFLNTSNEDQQKDHKKRKHKKKDRERRSSSSSPKHKSKKQKHKHH